MISLICANKDAFYILLDTFFILLDTIQCTFLHQSLRNHGHEIAEGQDVLSTQPPTLGNILNVVLMKRLNRKEAFGGPKVRTTEEKPHSIGGRTKGVGNRQETHEKSTKLFPL